MVDTWNFRLKEMLVCSKCKGKCNLQEINLTTRTLILLKLDSMGYG
jgi:hypothetical protein